MKFFVWYSTGKYDPPELKEFDDEAEVLKLLRTYAGNPSFEFKVIQGSEIKFEPVSVATDFRRAGQGGD